MFAFSNRDQKETRLDMLLKSGLEILDHPGTKEPPRSLGNNCQSTKLKAIEWWLNH